MKKEDFTVVLLEWRDTESLYKYTLGLHYLTAVLRQAGFHVVDTMFERTGVHEAVTKVLSFSPSLVGIHFYAESEEFIFEFMREIKRRDPKVATMVGGHTATLYAASILQKEPCIDLISYGEGEKTVVDLCERLCGKIPLDGCRGIFYRKNGLIKRNPPRELIEDLDTLPFPALDTLIEENKNAKTVFAAISTSRGCKGNCGFCITNRVFDGQSAKTWRGRSPASVVNELLHLKQVFPDKRLVYRIVDGSFEDPDPIEKSRLCEIIRLFSEHEIRIPFGILTRAESWKEEDEDLIKKMKRQGLYEVGIGFEASTDKSLKVMNKRACTADNYRAYDLFTRNGINVFGFLIMFHPYTEFEELRKNAEFLLDMDMGYQTQNWWSELYLWPDSRILPRIVRDGLLLGPGSNGYQLEYSFMDGRVAKVRKILRKVSVLPSLLKCRETIEKYKIECGIYEIWREQYSDMRAIETDVRAYIEYYRKQRKELGQKQYELFLRILKAVAGGDDRETVSQIIADWDDLLQKYHVVLEQEWMKYRMKFGRKKVLLI